MENENSDEKAEIQMAGRIKKGGVKWREEKWCEMAGSLRRRPPPSSAIRRPTLDLDSGHDNQ